MELSKIVTGVILLLVGVILVSALVLPTISNVQKISGDAIEYENESIRGYDLKAISDDLEITVTQTSVTINGVVWANNSQSAWYVVTDSWYVWYGSTAQSMIFVNENNTKNINGGSITLSGGEYAVNLTYDNGTISITGAYSWVFVPAEDGEYVTVEGSSTRYVNDLNDYVMSGYYSTGENDTYYSYFNGVAKAGEYEASVSGDLSLVDGTTDIYSCPGVVFHVGEEEFNPFLCLVKATVSGHATSGTAYTLFGLIPLLLIVSLVLVPVGLIAMRSYFGRSD